MRKLIIGLTLLCSVSILALITLELALSKFAPNYRTVHQNILKDRLIIAKSIVNRRWKFRYNKFMKMNSHGFRDKERTYGKKEGVFRILVLGDSMTEGLQLPLEQSYPYILEKKFNSENSGRVEVINLAVSGFNTAKEYLMLQYYGLRYQPDLVILAFFTGDDVRNNLSVLENRLVNDSGGEINNEHKPIFVSSNEKVGEGAFEIGINGSGKEATKKDEDGLFRPFHIIKRISVGLFPNISYPLIDWVKDTPWIADFFLKSGSAKNRSKIIGAPECYQVYTKKYPLRLQSDWKITKFLISKLAKELGKSGTKFLVVVIPNEFEFMLDKWDKVLRRYPEMRSIDFDVKKPEHILVRFLERNNIDYLLLRPKLEEYSRKTGKDLYLSYKGGFHWNSNGHSFVAQLLYKKLKDYKTTPRVSYTSLKRQIVRQKLLLQLGGLDFLLWKGSQG